jgi:DNA-binding NarL/FixJ family response regulator
MPANHTATRIVLADDHALVRDGIKRLLNEAGFCVCGEAADGKEAIQTVLALKPDLVLMDITMPVMNGIEATKEIRFLSPETKILIVSMHNSPQIMKGAAEAGAHGFFVKSGGLHELQKAILGILSQPSPAVPSSTVTSATC